MLLFLIRPRVFLCNYPKQRFHRRVFLEFSDLPIHGLVFRIKAFCSIRLQALDALTQMTTLAADPGTTDIVSHVRESEKEGDKTTGFDLACFIAGERIDRILRREAGEDRCLELLHRQQASFHLREFMNDADEDTASMTGSQH